MTTLSESVGQLRTNPRQWAAFTTEGHCVVLAPPGSGKTRLLSTRVAYDLINRIPLPHGAACITLTNPAANQLRRRIDDLGVEPRSTFFVGTVHSFALTRIVLPFAQAAGRTDLGGLSVAHPPFARSALTDSIVELFGSGDHRLVRSTIEHNRRRLVSQEHWARTGPLVQEAARRYLDRLRQRGLMDFEDVVQFAVELVEQRRFVRRVLTARYPHLYVDEYQDLAPGLDRLVRALCFDHYEPAELFAVGDPDQAILGFTGTRPELLHDLASLPGVTRIELDINYRCGSEIIRRSQLLLTGRRGPITGHRPGGVVAAHHEPAGFDAQVRSAAGEAQRAANSGSPLHEIVVLCSTNEECLRAATLFRQADVPAYVRGGEYDQTPPTLLVEALAAWATLGHEASGHRLGDLLRRWRDLLAGQWDRSTAVQLVSLLLEGGVRSARLAADFLRDVRSLGLDAALLSAGRTDEAASLDFMGQVLTAGPLRGYSLRDLAERARNVGRVEVATMTSGKGLEFDVVLLLGADEGKLPHFASLDGSEELREDRRKFYVSITRARREVHVYYSGFTVNRFGRVWPRGPSRFLTQLGLLAPLP